MTTELEDRAYAITDDIFNGETGPAVAALRLREVLAEIWDEGYEAYGNAMAGWGPDDPQNPYRS